MRPVKRTIRQSTGITHLRRRTGLAHLTFPWPAQRAGLSQVLAGLAEREINIYLAKKAAHHVSLAVDVTRADEAVEALQAAGANVRRTQPCAVACLVASDMKYESGVMYRMVRVLKNEGVPILGTSDSFNSVGLLVHESHIDKALAALSREFKVSEKQEREPLDPW